jgi:hypothetical protein
MNFVSQLLDLENQAIGFIRRKLQADHFNVIDLCTEDEMYVFTNGVKSVTVPVDRFDMRNITFMEPINLISLIDMLLC